MRVGCVGYATEQGIGHLPKWFYDHGIITDMMVFRHGSRPSHMEWYPEGTIELASRPFTGPQVEEFVSNLDVMLIFETPFDWSFIPFCQSRGVPVALMPMYECTPVNIPHQPDLFINPSLLDQQYFPNGTFLPVPVDPSIWKKRTHARKFVHNGGHLGLRGHKGTKELLEAIPLVAKPVDITIRAQDQGGLRALVNPHILQHIAAANRRGGAKTTIEFGPIPYDRLFDADVLIAAEKYNGLSLPLQEARAAGMLVMTSNRFPHNTWLPNEPLIPVTSYSKQRVGGGYMEYDEALITPKDIAATIDAWFERDITEYSMSGWEWAEANSWERLRPRYLEVLGNLPSDQGYRAKR